MTDGIHLTGLQGTNPLGFLAALGVQVLFEHEQLQPRLWWTDDVIPHAIVDNFNIDQITDQAMKVFKVWQNSTAFNPGFGNKADNTAKFNREELRLYLANNRSDEPGTRFASALVAEGSYDGKDGTGDTAKPSDLYFAAGPAKFLSDARKVLKEDDKDQVEIGLLGPWPYDSSLPSFRWDVGDDPQYALAAEKPGVDKKTNPGPEALALLGLSMFPVYGKPGRTLTQGCSGPWRRGGAFTWPLWTRPAGRPAVQSLLAHVSYDERPDARRRWYQAWGVSLVMQSSIKRTDQGGYGNVGPPRYLHIS